jgi:YD repeat-containing protein
VWRFDYDERGDLTRSVDPTGYERHREFDIDHQTLRDEWGIRIDERTDFFGRSTVVTDGEGGEVRFEYDAVGNPLRRINPDGTAAWMRYDRCGRPAVFTDEMGHRLHFVRDAAEASLRIVRPDGSSDGFEYSLSDELTMITNSRGETARFAYDGADRCTSITYYDGRQHVITYDDADNPLTVEDGRTGQVLARCKYADDLLVEESYHDGRQFITTAGSCGLSTGRLER